MKTMEDSNASFLLVMRIWARRTKHGHWAQPINNLSLFIHRLIIGIVLGDPMFQKIPLENKDVTSTIANVIRTSAVE